MKKGTQMDLQHDFKKRNNKPGDKASPSLDSKDIKKAKQIMKTTD
ncbi:hypothetical protein [Clostridium thailandense]|nr:hypothetical protein [Clostridium thailandense]